MQHEAGTEIALHTGHEAARTQLREGVVTAVRGDDVVPGLSAAVEAHHQPRLALAHEKVGDRPLARIPETEVDDDPGFSRHRL